MRDTSRAVLLEITMIPHSSSRSDETIRPAPQERYPQQNQSHHQEQLTSYTYHNTYNTPRQQKMNDIQNNAK